MYFNAARVLLSARAAKKCSEQESRRPLLVLTKDLQGKQAQMESKLQDLQATQEEKLKEIEEKLAQQQKFNDELLALLKDSC